MEPWHWWLIAALILIICEIFFSDFLLATLGAACFVTAVAAGFGLEFTAQLGTFIVSAILALALLRPAMKRWLYLTSDPAKSNTHAMVGQRGTVTTVVGGIDNPGRVKIGGEEWRAISESDEPLAEGLVVEIISVDSATVIVRPITAEPKVFTTFLFS
ncbi:MAG: NfeD family protein [Verrucomicrobiae bacterium]|nr:NfeD family protein [Verrucomicrobiae bacterium]